MPTVRPASRLFALALILGACGAPAEPLRSAAPTGIGVSSGDETVATPAAVEGSIELALRRPDGTFIDVGDLRGSIVVLFLFATFDGMSQMALRPLGEFAEAESDVRVVGIAVQPGARLLIDAYESALSPPFPVTYDPEETVPNGTSSLGAIESIPTYIVLDERGVEVARHTGYADGPQLGRLLAAAR